MIIILKGQEREREEWMDGKNMNAKNTINHNDNDDNEAEEDSDGDG